MTLQHLYFGFEGRISRKPFWIGNLVLVAIGLAIAAAIWGFVGEQTRLGRAIATATSIALAFPTVALMAKRLHDRGRTAWWSLIYVVPWMAIEIADLMGLTGAPADPNRLGYVLLGLAMLALLWVIVDLGMIRGEAGPNRYGPDPLAREPRNDSVERPV